MLIKNKNLYFFFLFLFFLVSFFININKVFAATVNFSPISGTYNVGDTIKIKVNVSSDRSINAVASSVYFSSDVLSLTSISKSSSIVSLWAQEPSFSNKTGLASFEGVILSGYAGNAGNIVTLVFKAKSVGVATLRFSNVSILANDGNGTDIFSGSLFTASINIEKAIKIPSVKKETTASNCEGNANIEKQESTVACVAINAVEKIKEVEVSNNLPNNSLLITVIIVFIIVLSFITIYLFILVFRLKRYLKNKLLKTENVVLKNFKSLEKDIESKIADQKGSKSTKISKEEDDILEEVIDTEEKIIKEVEKIEDDL